VRPPTVSEPFHACSTNITFDTPLPDGISSDTRRRCRRSRRGPPDRSGKKTGFSRRNAALRLTSLGWRRHVLQARGRLLRLCRHRWHRRTVAGQWRLGGGRARHLLARSPSHYGRARPGFHERPSRIARGKRILGAAILGMGDGAAYVCAGDWQMIGKPPYSSSFSLTLL